MRPQLATSAALVLSLLVMPDVGTTSTVIPPAPASVSTPVSPSTLEFASGSATRSPSDLRTADRTPTSTNSAGYRDFCNDGGVADVSGLDLTDDGTTLSVRWTGCLGSPIDTSRGAVRLVVIPLGSASSSHVLTHRWSDGRWQLFDTNGSTRQADWTLLQSGTAAVGSVPQPNGEVVVNAASADLPTSFRFELATYVDGALTDVLPDTDMPTTTFPDSCDATSSQRRSVSTTGPAATASVASALEAAGYRVSGRSATGLEVEPDPGPLHGVPGVVAVEPVFTYAPAASDDPLNSGWAQDLIDLDGAWAVVASSPATVAVLDQGVNGRLAEFGGRIGAGINAVTGGTFPAGANSTLGHHGTMVSSVIAATHSDGIGVAGVNNGVTIVPVLVADHSTCITDPVLSAAVDGAVAAGVDIINMSLSGPGDSRTLREAVARAVDAGVVVLAATGNHGGTEPHYPANYDGVIGVGAIGADGLETSYSGRTGADLLAPGGDDADPVVVLDRYGTPMGSTGTSFATPYAAGVASLILARTDDPAQVLLDTAASRVLDAAAAVAAVPTPRPTLVAVDTAALCGAFGGTEFAFTDNSGGSLESFVRCVAGLGVSQGFPDGTFRGSGTLTVEQTAAFVLRALETAGVPVAAADEVPDAYGDDDATYFEPELNRLAALGIPARRNATANPTRGMTRAAMAEWVSSALAVAGAVPDTPYEDVFPDDDGIARESFIDDIASFGIVTGRVDGTFGPQEVLTRGEMSVFLSRLVALLRAE